MKRSLWIIVALLILIPAGVLFAAPNMEEGLWKITITTEMPGMPSQSHTSTTCLTKEKTVPQTTQKECKIENIKTDGNIVTWTITCKQGMKSKGRVTYAGNTMEGETETTVTTDGKTMTIKSTMKGKRIGPCK